ncbi:Homolog of plant auxin-responsive GH3-like protein [Richelia intracellularis HH01]|uniref:Homolog of plant auxin-responsive GH3-like protein n=1 Tax=Richelia intracellularis HH01 TaxID=1165094 RepID=M1WR34_9NOST|nr:GH3 auxin-responsive promoter family protein [Richelia intracellularis]CCH66689.1 Homolog of plant auxin-responsive GH3-like protein [Richelia intracellularis HH01]
MKNLVLPTLTSIGKIRKASFVRRTRKVSFFQEKFLYSLLYAYQGTELGKKYGLGDIKNIDQFRQRLPVQSYRNYETYIEKIAKGEPNILTPDPVVYLNLTSGSTGKQKLIPVTKRSRQVLNHTNQVGIGFITEAAHKCNLPIGKLLLTSSVKLIGSSSGGIPFGHISAGDLRLNKMLYQQLFAHPYETLLPIEPRTRYYVCLLFALRNCNMRIIGANFPILGLQLANYLNSHAEELIHNLKTGKIAPWLQLEPNLRVKLQRQFSPLPQRAMRLEQILKSEGKLTPQLAWPNLSFIITARGGTSNFYFERFPDYFGDIPIFGGIYASSEATFGIYHEFNNDGVILAIDSGFFEFIPPEQWNIEDPKTLLPQELQVGQHYRILVTNYSGLYRYDIGDVIEVVGFFNQTPLISFRHRVGGLLSSTTEKTSEFHAIQVMQQLQKEFNLPLENFCITLSEHELPAHYLLNIELIPGSEIRDPERFLAEFDNKLQQANISYQDKRKNNIVPPPRLRIVAHGSFAKIRQRSLKRGISDSQFKFAHVSEDRKMLSGILIQQEVRLPGDCQFTT